MRRTFATLAACLAVTGCLLVLPVYAAPAPQARPVEVSIDELELGSVTAPKDDAVVTTDGAPEAGGVTDAEARAVPSPKPAEQGTAPAEDRDADDDGLASSGDELAGVPALTVSQPDTDKFSTVGVTWRQDGLTDVVVQLRVKDAEEKWGTWTTLEADDVEQTVTSKTEDRETRGGTAPYWTDDAYGIEVIVQGAGGEAPRDVQLALVDPGTSKADAIPAGAGVQDQANAGTAMPPVITRAGWGADESLRTWDSEYAPTLKAATLHHTADRNNYTAADVPGMMRSIYAYHAVTRGWGDIGYNVIVDKFGRIFEGRGGGLASTVIGAHAGGFNTGTFGVSMLGNYGEVDAPAVMMDAVASIMAWKLGLYGVDPKGTTQLTSGGGGTSKYAAGQVVTLPTVFGHRDVGSTTCPGQYAYDRLGQLRDAVVARTPPPMGSPGGNLEQLSISGNTLSAAGWVYDPDNPTGAVPVHVLVDGVTVVEWPASVSRPDVGAAYPAAGPNHGFNGTLSLSQGKHSVCVVAINVGASGANNWLGCRTVTATAQVNPFGNVESVVVKGRTLSVQGWTIDPDAKTSPLDVHIYVNGAWGTSVVADRYRPDVGAAYPSTGGNHGFSWSQELTAPGNYTVCVYAINQNAGTANPELACRSVSVSAEQFNPVGDANGAVVNGNSVALTGWAYDVDDRAAPVAVHLYVDGVFAKSVPADVSRPDVAAAFPGAGDRHGYATSVEVPPGARRVCAYAINIGHGTTNPLLGCRSVNVPASAWNPVGNLELAQRAGGTVNVGGWTIDRDIATGPVDVHVYVDGRWGAAVRASGDRPDVAAVYPDAGAAHGFSTTLPVSPGSHTVCAYAINVGYGSTNPLLGCRTVSG